MDTFPHTIVPRQKKPRPAPDLPEREPGQHRLAFLPFMLTWASLIFAVLWVLLVASELTSFNTRNTWSALVQVLPSFGGSASFAMATLCCLSNRGAQATAKSFWLGALFSFNMALGLALWGWAIALLPV